ncbi:MAG: ribosome biogenesis GTPase Der [Leptospiraceae bacterium]|nr:ribosome biogenesis GTPase Der [Leptospiraceae bacterium]MCP5501752.1 ribosome biogenesis GTPase Der [Leptospiraceae bacterium]
MNAVPKVTIVGRQNVGKSSLFNLLSKTKLAITHDYPGVTRDILETTIKRKEFQTQFVLCDSPGLDLEKTDELSTNIIRRAEEQLNSSDLIVFVLDKTEVTEYDYKLAELFMRDKNFQKKDIIYCVNKADKEEDDLDLELFYRIGLPEILPISVKGRRNIKLLIEKMNFFLTSRTGNAEKNIDYSISIIGKPNSGKSSLLNALSGQERAVVSNVPGTTRDSINFILTHKEKVIEIIDTAGIRKQSKVSKDKIEFLSFNRTIKTIESSNIVVHMIDAEKGVGEFDKKIFGLIREKKKPLLLVINKWDLIQEKDSNTFEKYKKHIISRFFALKEVPIISISATQRQRIFRVLNECDEIHRKLSFKVSTSKLNQDIQKWMSENKMIGIMKRAPKLYYSTQVSTSPFKVLCFVNDESLFKKPVLTYLKKRILEEYDLKGFDVEIEIRPHRKKR